MPMQKSTEIGRIADQLERSYHGGAWHGPATREVLSGVGAADAARTAEGTPNSIARLTRHMAFWMDAAGERIGSGRDVDASDDWASEEKLSEEAWAEVLASLDQAYARLHEVVQRLDDDRLDNAVPGADPTVRGLLFGVLQHNAYHTGQIVMLKRALGL